MTDSQDTSFARLVSLACHDLRTPLATVQGFARTIQRTHELDDPLPRYLEMIVAGATQMTELLEEVSLAARIEGGRYDPVLTEADTLDLAEAAARDREGIVAAGAGATVETDSAAVTRSLASLAECARKHGGVPEVTISVDGRVIAIAPIGDAGSIIVGDELKDLGAAVATRALRALGAEVGVEGDVLAVRL